MCVYPSKRALTFKVLAFKLLLNAKKWHSGHQVKGHIKSFYENINLKDVSIEEVKREKENIVKYTNKNKSHTKQHIRLQQFYIISVMQI